MLANGLAAVADGGGAASWMFANGLAGGSGSETPEGVGRFTLRNTLFFRVSCEWGNALYVRVCMRDGVPARRTSSAICQVPGMMGGP